VSDGRAYLHSRGIAHRDVRPSNILVFGGGVAKLRDLGAGDSLIFAIAEVSDILSSFHFVVLTHSYS
jgi:serine/threonine protein kinase